MRGYQRKVIFLKDTGSRLFDEAYFVISRLGEEARVEQSDMVYEANRIIKESLNGKESRRDGYKAFDFILPFTLGVITTLFITLTAYFLFLS